VDIADRLTFCSVEDVPSAVVSASLTPATQSTLRCIHSRIAMTRATPLPALENSRCANRMKLSDGQKRLGSRNGRTSLGRSDHTCCRDIGSSCRRLFSTRALYRIVTSLESEAECSGHRIAGHANESIGGTVLKAMALFYLLTVRALATRLVSVELLKPGVGMHIDPKSIDPAETARYVKNVKYARLHRRSAAHHSQQLLRTFRRGRGVARPVHSRSSPVSGSRAD